MNINIVVSCTAGKNLESVLEFDDYKEDLDAEDWLEDAEEGLRLPAIKLYKGPGADKFREIKKMIEEAGHQCTVWILSAGFGIVKEDTLLPGYDATFSPMAKFNRVKPPQFALWLNSVTQQELPKNSLLLLPNSYLKPFKTIEDVSDHIEIGPFGEVEREMIGCSMIRVQLEASQRIIKYGLAMNIAIEDWSRIPLSDAL